MQMSRVNLATCCGGLLEPSEELEFKSIDGLLVGRALVNVAGTESVPVRLLNLARHPKRIKWGTQIATCSAVESVIVEKRKAMVVCKGSRKCCVCKGNPELYS